ncbi:MAG: GNAT family N-acetyltransferase [Marivibrio sp.]|uniref:GNAT family N-acetyltransferase n=1 Tax=Marivibrio sp. TaxID=2039719 RepID=UPI0032EDDB13
MSGRWSLRRARPEDAATLAALAAEAFAPYIARIGRRPAPMDADYAAAAAAGRATVALDASGAAAGFIVARPSEDPRRWMIETIAVAPSLQGRGLGRRLLAAAEADGRAAGARIATLYTNAAMTENLDFYPRRGYRETDRRREDGFERIYFEKSLGAGEDDAPTL